MPLNPRGLRGIAALALIIAILAAASAIPAQATGTTQESPTIQAGRELDGSALAQLQARPQGHPKIDSQLNELIAQGTGPSLASAAEERGIVTRGDQAQVYVQVDPAQVETARRLIADQGGQATGTSMDGTTIQAFVPVAALEQVANDATVQFVRRPVYVEPMGELRAGLSLSEGVAVSNAAAWHAAGRRGAGIKVAVMDVGFEGYQDLLGADLPANVDAVNFVDTGSVTDGGPHGTACAEIVYDMAPGVQIMLLRVSSNIDVEEATNYAINQGAHIISASIGTNGITAGDGSGGHTELVARARNAGIFWATAAGNERQKHWGGVAEDTDGDNFVEITNNGVELNCVTVVAGECPNLLPGFQMSAVLRWNDWQAPSEDYALIIARNDGSGWRIFAVSDDPQNGGNGQFPVEFVSASTTGGPALYAFAIQIKDATRPANFDLFVRGGWRLEDWEASRSLTDQSASPNIFVVAALDSTAPFPQENYSSEGPTLGPGGAFTGGIIKPDLAAFANVNTQAYGSTPGSKFNGTSSATPHVAGAAALIRGTFTSHTPEQIANFLIERAVDMGETGKDTRFGFGRLWLGDPPTGGGGGPTLRKRFDFNADGTADLLWRHAGNGNNGLWFMSNGRVQSSASLPRVLDNDWRIVGSGDFNGDRKSDILWRNITSGSNAIWLLNGARVTSNLGLPQLTDQNWRVAGTGDFNGDGHSDIFWRHMTRGVNALWFISNGRVQNFTSLPNVAAAWNVGGLGDFNGDRKSDIFWRHSTLGNNAMWLMNGGTISSAVTMGRVADLNWRVAGAGDFNADGRSDIIWRHMTNGSNGLWLMNGAQVTTSVALPQVTDMNWRLIHDGDLNNDQRADVIWRNSITGANAVWLMNGTTVESRYLLSAVTDRGWQIMGNGNVGTGSSAGAFSEPAEEAPTSEELPLPSEPMELGEPGESPEGEAVVEEELTLEEPGEKPTVSEADPSAALPNEQTYKVHLPMLFR